MNENQKLVGTDKRLKIFKTATQVSIMDVTPALDYHRTKDDEQIYSGSMSFLINEYGRSKNIINTVLSKSACKLVFNAIIDGSFMNIFPNGFEKYGGSIKTKRAKILSIKFEYNQSDFTKSRYIFQIDEGQADIGKNGQIKMKKREKSVRTYVAVHLAIEMAHEIIDYIRHEELISLINNKPLYSWSTYQYNNQHNGYNQTQNVNGNQQQPMNQGNQQFQNQYGYPPPEMGGW